MRDNKNKAKREYSVHKSKRVGWVKKGEANAKRIKLMLVED